MESNVLSRRLFIIWITGINRLGSRYRDPWYAEHKGDRAPKPLSCLSLEEYSILVAIADCLLPSNPPFPAASELKVAFHIDTLLTTVHSGNHRRDQAAAGAG